MIEPQTRWLFSLLLCLIPGVLALDVGGTYECSFSSTANGQDLIITFRIDGSKYPSECDGTNGLPNFLKSPDDNLYNANCTMTTDIRTSCTFNADDYGCGCISDANGDYVVQYRLQFLDTTDLWWQADISCIDLTTSGPKLDFTTTTCNPVTRPAPPVCDFCECGDCKDKGGCWGCILLIVVVLVLCVGGAVFFILYKKGCFKKR